MKLFEFEAKNILKQYGMPVPKGNVASSSGEAEVIAREIGKPVVLKSQVLVSGRGNVVTSLLVEEKLDVVEQFYASIAIDRQAKTYIVLASTSGGMDIEETALDFPDRISRHWVDPTIGFSELDAIDMVKPLNISQADATKFASIIGTLYKVTMDYDAELAEINPLAKTPSDEFIAADARIIVDDNALFRHPEFKDRTSIRVDDTPLEAEARKQKLAYVDLSGNIGIIGNGAGLVMATLDLVHLFGGKPANFLDIGGGAQVEIIKGGVMLVMSKPEVKAVLINILGGITRCDIVAQGIVDGLNESAVKKPIAVRLIGTNEEAGARILHQAGVHIYSNMEEAVRQALKL